jgi:hypothetical protein
MHAANFRKLHPDAPDPIRAEELKSNKDRCGPLADGMAFFFCVMDLF